MRIGIVSSEAVPFSKTGGLADVTGSLFRVFNELGNETYLFLPYYKITKSKINNMSEVSKVNIKIGDKNIIGSVYIKEISKGMHVVLIQQSDYFDRDNLYGTKGRDYPDNVERFGFFDYAVIESIKAIDTKLDVLHLNDWQTGLIPLLLKDKGMQIKTLFTIHNLAYQGNFPRENLEILHVDEKYFSVEGIEFYGNLSFIKSGIVYSDLISTVSPTYAKEILTEEYGEKLNGILTTRKDSLIGIVNGIDYKIWDSETDDNIFKNYSLGTIKDKEENKNKLGNLLGLDLKEKPLFGMVSRIASQKGLDILVEALPQFLNKNVRIIILGTGEKVLEDSLKGLEAKFPSKLKFIIGFDDALAHKIYASSDFFLMPSKYEPCGLGQLISLKYGAIPIVHETGGLKDTIDNLNDYTKCGNGLSFQDYSSKELLDAMNKAIEIYKDTEMLNKIRKIAMLCDFSWQNSAKEYLRLFERMVK